MNWSFNVAIAIAVLHAAACVSYQPSSTHVPLISAEKILFTDGYGVAAEAYVDIERQKTFFDANFLEAGMIPIHLRIVNKTHRDVLVRRTDILLKLPDSTEIATLSSHSAAQQVGLKSAALAAGFTLGILGAIMASEAEDRARASRIIDYQRKELKTTTLRTDDSAHGFVYFMLPPGTKPFDSAELTVRFVDPEAVTSRTLSILLTGLGLKGRSTQ